MYNQSHILAIAAMAVSDHSLLLQHGIGSALGHLVYHLREVGQSLDGAYGYAMVQWNDDCVPAVSIHYPLNSDSLTNLTQIQSPSHANM